MPNYTTSRDAIGSGDPRSYACTAAAFSALAAEGSSGVMRQPLGNPTRARVALRRGSLRRHDHTRTL